MIKFGDNYASDRIQRRRRLRKSRKLRQCSAKRTKVKCRCAAPAVEGAILRTGQGRMRNSMICSGEEKAHRPQSSRRLLDRASAGARDARSYRRTRSRTRRDVRSPLLRAPPRRRTRSRRRGSTTSRRCSTPSPSRYPLPPPHPRPPLSRRLLLRIAALCDRASNGCFRWNPSLLTLRHRYGRRLYGQ